MVVKKAANHRPANILVNIAVKVVAKGAKRLAKNLANAEVVKIVINVENANIVKVANIAKQLARNQHNVEAVNLIAKRHAKAVAKHHVSQAAKRAHRQTPHRQHRQQLRFRMKLKAAIRLLFNGVRQATAIYRDIYFKKRPTAERGHKFTKARREAFQTPLQSAQVRFSTV